MSLLPRRTSPGQRPSGQVETPSQAYDLSLPVHLELRRPIKQNPSLSGIAGRQLLASRSGRGQALTPRRRSDWPSGELLAPGDRRLCNRLTPPAWMRTTSAGGVSAGRRCLEGAGRSGGRLLPWALRHSDRRHVSDGGDVVLVDMGLER
jgi:hypothetical protein